MARCRGASVRVRVGDRDRVRRHTAVPLIIHCCGRLVVVLLLPRQARVEARGFGAVVFGSAARTLGPVALLPLVRARYERRLGLG